MKKHLCPILILVLSILSTQPAHAQQRPSGGIQIVPGAGLYVDKAAKVSGVVRRTDLGAPALATVNRIVTSTNMIVGSYTIAAQPDVARNVTVTQTAAGTTDTSGTVVITGTDVAGNALSETITPVAGSTVAGVNAFKTVTSVVGAGWVLNATSTSTIDTITVGTGTRIGLPFVFTSPSDFALGVLGTAVGFYPTTGSAVLATSTIDASASTYDGTKKLYIYADH